MNQKPTKESFHFADVGDHRFLNLRPTGKFTQIFSAILLAASCAVTARAQGDIPSGKISGSGTGPYIYDLTFSDSASATSAIGSIWYAWVPGAFFLPGDPTSVSVPSGWNFAMQNNSIQFFATSSASDIQPGHSLSGFSYDAGFSGGTLATTPNSGLSYAYAGGIESDAGKAFTVQIIPEPSSTALFGVSALGLVVLGRRRMLARV